MNILPKNWKPDKNTDWLNISYDYTLSEDFIRKYKDKVSWYRICVYQKLSESFIIEFKDKVDWDYIFVYQKHLSYRFFNRYQHKMNYKWRDIRRRYF